MKSKLTRERIEQYANDPRMCNINDEIRELARMALAAMDSEPYGFTDGDRRGMIYEPQYADRLNNPIPVYRHAQPAPVVPAVSACLLHTAASAIEDLLTTKGRRGAGVWFDLPGKLRHAAMLQAGNSPVIPDGSEQRIAEAVELLKNAAPAMLSDDSGPNGPLVGRTKSPVTADDFASAAPTGIPMISNRWIPVSERLPEKNGMYQVWNGKHMAAHSFFFGSFQCINPEQITHWMPLPAAPQEAK